MHYRDSLATRVFVGFVAAVLVGCGVTDDPSLEAFDALETADSTLTERVHAVEHDAPADPALGPPGCGGIVDPPAPIALSWAALEAHGGHVTSPEGVLTLELGSNLDDPAQLRIHARVEADGDRRDPVIHQGRLPAAAELRIPVDLHRLLPELPELRYSARISLRAEVGLASGDVEWIHLEPVMLHPSERGVEVYDVEAHRRAFPSGDYRGLERLPEYETDPETGERIYNAGIGIAPPITTSPTAEPMPRDEQG